MRVFCVGMAALASLMTAAFIAGCTDRDGSGSGQTRSDRAASADPDRSRVVLYSSVDSVFLRDAVETLETTTGFDIAVVTDTEASKTFGLVQRLISEKDRPRADVWWSSEPFGTMRLSREGVLASWPSDETIDDHADTEPAGGGGDAGPDQHIEGNWPARLSGPTWRGFAERARVIVYSPARVDAGDVPKSLATLTEPRWAGRVGIARPEFGTTRGHMAVLHAMWGAEAFEAWLTAMRDNGARLYDSNSTVVREVAMGAIDLALTDTDDVWASQRAGRDVDMVYVGSSIVPDSIVADPIVAGSILAENRQTGSARATSIGPVLLPNTVAVIAGAPNPKAAATLARAIRSVEMERMLALTASRNIPAHPLVASEFPELAVPSPAVLDLDAAYAAEADAVTIVQRVFGS